MTGAPIPSGAEPVDRLLGGGYDRGTVTQVYGPPASGKTNLALAAAVATAEAGGSVLVIDAEGLSLDRFSQLAAGIGAGDTESITDRVMISAVHDFEEQREAVRAAADVAAEADLIVLDSATGFYRLERADEPEERRGDALRRLADQIAHLLGLARRHDLGVLITNQVFTDPDTDAVRPLGGYTLQHWSGTILRLERFRGGARKLTLEKHRSRSAGDSVRVRIAETGIEPLDDDRHG